MVGGGGQHQRVSAIFHLNKEGKSYIKKVNELNKEIQMEMDQRWYNKDEE